MNKVAKETKDVFGFNLTELARPMPGERIAGLGSWLMDLAKSGTENLSKLVRQVGDRVNTKKLDQITKRPVDWAGAHLPGGGAEPVFNSFMKGMAQYAKPFAAALARRKDLERYVLDANAMVNEMEQVMRSRGLQSGSIRMKFDKYANELRKLMTAALNTPKPEIATFYEYELAPSAVAALGKNLPLAQAAISDPRIMAQLERSLANNSIKDVMEGGMKYTASIPVKIGRGLQNVPLTIRLKPGAEAGIQQMIDKEFAPVYETVRKFEGENLWMKQLPKAALHLAAGSVALQGAGWAGSRLKPGGAEQADSRAKAVISDPFAGSSTHSAVGDQLGVDSGDMTGAPAEEDQLFPGAKIQPGSGDFEGLKRWNRDPNLDPRHLVPVPENAEFDMYGFRRSELEVDPALARLAQRAPPVAGARDVASVGKMLGGDPAKMAGALERLVATMPNSGNPGQDMEALYRELTNYAQLNAAALEQIGDGIHQPVLATVEMIIDKSKAVSQ